MITDAEIEKLERECERDPNEWLPPAYVLRLIARIRSAEEREKEIREERDNAYECLGRIAKEVFPGECDSIEAVQQMVREHDQLRRVANCAKDLLGHPATISFPQAIQNLREAINALEAKQRTQALLP